MPLRRADLRRRALQRLAADPPPGGDETDVRRLLHELQVHQVELELQNEELQRARAETEAMLLDYTELYEQAPVGYLTLDRDGRILQANPAAATLLGTARDRLVDSPLAECIERMDRPAFRAFLQRLATPEATALCELTLERGGSELRIVQIDGRSDRDGARLRITLSDTTNHRLSSNALRRSETQLRRAYRQLAQAQESERLRLTERLHDQIGRNLTALGLNLTLLDEESPAPLPSGLRERLVDSQALLKATVTEVRSLMSELYPPMLPDYGLFAALRWWSGEVAKRHGIEVRVADGEPGPRLSAEVESALFRIAQEALANAARHARPSRIDVLLRRHGDRLRLEIVDNGCGFDPDSSNGDDERGSWGLMLMRERALAIGARLQVDSTPGRGTRICVDTEGGHCP